MSSLNICITGATGYIGSALLSKLLSLGHTITVLTRNKDAEFPVGVRIVIGDLTSDDYFLDNFLIDCDVLYHCAGQINNKKTMHDLHAIGTQNLIRAISNKNNSKKIHWIQLSSVGVYGANPGNLVSEKSDLKPDNIYEKTKLMSDEIVLEAASSGLFTADILRPSIVYSSDMKNQSIFNLIEMIDRGLFFYVEPNAFTNFIHLDNVISALVLLSSKSNNLKIRIYNLSDCRSIRDIVRIICANLNRSDSFISVPIFLTSFISFVFGFIPGFPLTRSRFKALSRKVAYDSSKIRQELGYFHVYDMEHGMASMVIKYLNSR